MKQKDFAAYCNVSTSAISKAVKENRIFCENKRIDPNHPINQDFYNRHLVARKGQEKSKSMILTHKHDASGVVTVAKVQDVKNRNLAEITNHEDLIEYLKQIQNISEMAAAAHAINNITAAAIAMTKNKREQLEYQKMTKKMIDRDDFINEMVNKLDRLTKALLNDNHLSDLISGIPDDNIRNNIINAVINHNKNALIEFSHALID